MDPYTDSKSRYARWEPQPRKQKYKYNNTSRRTAFKTGLINDLEDEYQSAPGKFPKSASAFVKWFNSPEDEFEESAQDDDFECWRNQARLAWTGGNSYFPNDFIADDEDAIRAVLEQEIREKESMESHVNTAVEASLLIDMQEWDWEVLSSASEESWMGIEA
jgi:hypothetical protein